MPLYKVTIQRSFEVTIETENRNKASKLVGLFLGYRDESNQQDRIENDFLIRSVEMLENDVIEIIESEKDEVS